MKRRAVSMSIVSMMAHYNRPTMSVTGAGAGVDSAWEQKKLEARKMLENAAESPASSVRFVGQFFSDFCLIIDDLFILLIFTQCQLNCKPSKYYANPC
jgi:hypothetical protein